MHAITKLLKLDRSSHNPQFYDSAYLPQASWLHKIGVSPKDTCHLCEEAPQTGDHLVFDCPTPTLAGPRTKLLLERTSWEELDADIHIKEEGQEEAFEATQEFFHIVFVHLT